MGLLQLTEDGMRDFEYEAIDRLLEPDYRRLFDDILADDGWDGVLPDSSGDPVRYLEQVDP